MERELGTGMSGIYKEIAEIAGEDVAILIHKNFRGQQVFFPNKLYSSAFTAKKIKELPIPDYVFEAILQERERYERNRSRRSTTFQDLDYICCSSYGRPRSKNYHWKHYKKLLQDNDLPDIRWHDLRSTFCTLLLKNDFNPKAVSKLMGHAKELISVDVYGDNMKIIADGVPEIEVFMQEVLPEKNNSGILVLCACNSSAKRTDVCFVSVQIQCFVI